MKSYPVELQECLDRSLSQFASVGDLEMVVKLVHQGADVLFRNQEPLRLANQNDHTEVEEFLIGWMFWKTC